MKKRVVIIGGGAAGFFAAINLAEKNSKLEIIILEKTQKLLTKVKVSGGGRCNVTNNCFNIEELVLNYPRGEKELLQVFSKFAVPETIEWFNNHGILLNTEDDNRMFPDSNNSQQIIDCFMKLIEKYKIKIQLGSEVLKIIKTDNHVIIECLNETIKTNAVIVTSGGFNKKSAYNFIAATGHKIVSPIPSLFTINLIKNPVTELMGVSVKNAEVKISGTKLRYRGPVLITHWGFSGPAVLKLSAFAAQLFFEKNYDTEIIINWTAEKNEDYVREDLRKMISEKTKVLPANSPLYYLPSRLWNYLLEKSGIDQKKNWSEQNRKGLNKLVSNLFADTYSMKGKTTFKEEFVSCGGVDLFQVDMKTMESKIVNGVFFAGEVLNIDGITGGFNFQAAWSTSFVAASAVAAF